MSDTIANKIEGSQRLGPLAGIPLLLTEFGCPVEEVVKGLDIEPAIFDDPESRIPYPVVGRLLDRCAHLTSCRYFGLVLGSRYDHQALGAPGALMRNAPNLGAALSVFCALQSANSRGAVVYLHRAGDQVVFGYGAYEPAAVGLAQIYGFSLAIGVNMIRALTGGAVEPVEVLVGARQPTDANPYKPILKAPVRFNQPETGIVLHHSALLAPIPGASAPEFARLRERIAMLAPSSAPDRVWTDQVKHAVRPLLLRGLATTADMAGLLDVNLRTLSRRLAAENTTFQQILEEVRYAIARELLEITELHIGEIASALAYAEHSNFSEAFRRWSGMTPSEWRQIRKRR
jgi:AraC-like DNA-binding protein